MSNPAQEELRKTILQQSDELTFKPRFGLFSQPISTAVGDNGGYTNTLPKRGENNKPKTGPKNILTTPAKSSKHPDDYFGPLNALATSDKHDIYVDPARRLLQIQNQDFKNGKTPDSSFKPASGNKILSSSAYQYVSQKHESPDPKRKRNQEGNVIVHPRNIQTNPMTTVQRTYLKHTQFIADPYNRAHVLEQERLKKEKLKQQDIAFKLNGHPTATFDQDINLYNNQSYSKPKTARSESLNIYKHDSPFKSPNAGKKGIYGYFSEFPPYMENPEKEKVKKAEDQEKKKGFRGMSTALSRPTPSILCNPSNIRASFRSSLNKH